MKSLFIADSKPNWQPHRQSMHQPIIHTHNDKLLTSPLHHTALWFKVHCMQTLVTQS